MKNRVFSRACGGFASLVVLVLGAMVATPVQSAAFFDADLAFILAVSGVRDSTGQSLEGVPDGVTLVGFADVNDAGASAGSGDSASQTGSAGVNPTDPGNPHGPRNMMLGDSIGIGAHVTGQSQMAPVAAFSYADGSIDLTNGTGQEFTFSFTYELDYSLSASTDGLPGEEASAIFFAVLENLSGDTLLDESIGVGTGLDPSPQASTLSGAFDLVLAAGENEQLSLLSVDLEGDATGVVPLPAAWWLMLSGLALIRRRRAGD